MDENLLLINESLNFLSKFAISDAEMTADQNLSRSLMMITNETDEDSGEGRKYLDTSGLRIIFLAGKKRIS